MIELNDDDGINEDWWVACARVACARVACASLSLSGDNQKSGRVKNDGVWERKKW